MTSPSAHANIGLTMPRDDFTPGVKRQLADRAGHRCSFPTCPKSTSGPSDEHASAVSMTGKACHITAASAGRGARRYDPTMTPEKRASYDNGIWMCGLHGDVIDKDEKRYSVQHLKKWRQIREELAHIQQTSELPESVLINLGLATDRVQLEKLGDENVLFGQAIDDTSVPVIWGTQVADAIRDVAIELARNAFEHGGASIATLEIQPNRISLSDDGAQYGINELIRQGGNGGATQSALYLTSNFQNNVICSTRHLAGCNVTVFSRIRSSMDVASVTPCHAIITMDQLFSNQASMGNMQGCSTVYLVLPNYIVVSDINRRIAPAINTIINKAPQYQYVLAIDRISEHVRQMLANAVPRAVVMAVGTES